MRHKFQLFIGLFTCMVLVNCKHKCDPEETAAGCPGCCADQSLEGMRDYYFFKTGTYWIYEEANSGLLDTVTVLEDHEGITDENEYWLWIAYSSHYDYFFRYEYNESFSTYCINNPSCHCRKVNRQKYKPGDGSGEDNLFLFPQILGNYNNLSSGGVSTVIGIHDSMNIDGVTFQNVVSWHAENCTTEDMNHINWNDGTTCYFDISKNIGIFRRTLPEYNEVWNLIDFSIIQ